MSRLTRFLGSPAAKVIGFGVPMGVLLGAYEVQGKTMPTWIFWAIVVGSLIVLGYAFLSYLVEGLRSFNQHWSVQWPLRAKNRPDPNQWLYDHALEDFENPARHLLITNTYISNKDLRPTTRRPWIEFAFELYNGGVHTVVVGPARGAATYEDDTLADAIEGEKGRSSKPRGHSHQYKLKQFVPPDVAHALANEIDDRGAVRSMRLNDVKVEVRAEAEGAPAVWLSLANHVVYREREQG